MVDQKTARAAGVHGVLFTLQGTSPEGGKVALRVDDSSFRYTFGGDFASRLHVVQLLALTTPKLRKCQVQAPVRTAPGTTLPAQVTVPDARTGGASPTRTATASAGATVVMAATSDISGSPGDYSATSLSPAGTWF
ncbi:hypothetical protein ACWDE9_10975 [Streptomyces olivaceoviridis]